MDEFHSWRLQSILKSEIAEGNSVFKTSYNNGAEDTMRVIILSEPFKSAIRADQPPVSFREMPLEANCFKKAYYDAETHEVLACRIYQNPLKELKDIIFRRKLK